MSKLNLPNRLTLFRLILVPFVVAIIVLPESLIPGRISSLIALALFIVASVTDAIDGHIARSRNLITDFGKFLDPLADKFLVIGVMMALVYRYDSLRSWFFWVMLVVVFRELAVTSLRLMISSGENHIVLAAGKLGKIKTVCQMVCLCAVLFEPAVYSFAGLEKLAVWPPLTLVFSALTLIFTLWSGIDYFVKYGKYLDSSK